MVKYLRLLRLQDQYVEFVAVASAALLVNVDDPRFVWWAIGAICLSIPAYILNEIVDSKDVDGFSWNPVHIGKKETLDMRVVWVLGILLSVVGFWLVWNIGFIWWGVLLWILGIAYSWEPIRLKRRAGWDLIGQVATWWVIPFVAASWAEIEHIRVISFVTVTSFVILPVLFAYQFADMLADMKAKLQSTHVVLGMQQSLEVGFTVGVTALLLYIAFGLYVWAFWTIPLALLLVFVLGLYVRWMNLKTLPLQTQHMQWWVRRVKPLTQVYALLVLLLWWIA
jgi:4-hydroxybenzoate polyprenyltransferase